jgi:hypothetical protein
VTLTLTLDLAWPTFSRISPADLVHSISLRKRRNSRCRWRGVQVPMTLPSSMFAREQTIHE